MLAHVASRIAASTRPPEKLSPNKRFAGNGAGAESEVAFDFSPSPLAVRSVEFEFQSVVASSRRNGSTNFLDPYLFAPCGA
jgi:hypothetical protein